jgi:hypothetical protein
MAEQGTKQNTTAKTKRPARKKAAAKRRKPSAKRPKAITAGARHQMIAEAAYYKAESRDFACADPELDWHEAEAEVDTLLLGTKSSKS